MKLAFLLYKFFPYGGMQRDFLRFSEESQKRGHSVRVYCINWQGEVPEEIELCMVPVRAWRNHRRNEKYYHWVQQHIAQNPVHGIVGFNKMPGLDVYYAADSCYLDKSLNERGHLYRMGSRFKHFRDYEQSVFGESSSTEILLISETEKKKFRQHYQTDEARLHMLPPGISPDRRAPSNSAEIRANTRQQWKLNEDNILLLFIGSGFIKKGLNRAIQAIANQPKELRGRCRLLVVGEDKSARYQRLAKRLGVAESVLFLGGRDDVPTLLLAADLLIHPALDEAAGIVLVEAVVAGLPVIVTDVCGYAHHIAKADAGEVLASPFRQEQLDSALRRAFDPDLRKQWKIKALEYAQSEDLYSMHATGAELIEKAIQQAVEKKQQVTK